MRKWVTSVGAGLLVAALACACGKKAPPSCEEAIDKAAAKIKDLADPKEKAQAVAECIRREWPPGTRSCIAESRDEPDVVACLTRLKKGGPSQGVDKFAESKGDVASMTTKKYAFEAYPVWSQAHPDQACPARLEELNEYMNNKDIKDPWGNDYKMFCGPSLPAGAKGLAAMSNGEDGKEGTPDDIKSW
jgi:hypothetical protein